MKSLILMFILLTKNSFAQTLPKPTGGRLDFKIEISSEAAIVNNFQLNLLLCDNSSRNVSSILDIQNILQSYITVEKKQEINIGPSSCPTPMISSNPQSVLNCLIRTNSIDQKAMSFYNLENSREYLIQIHELSPSDADASLEFLKHMGAMKSND